MTLKMTNSAAYMFIFVRVCVCVCICMKRVGKETLGRLRHRWEDNIKIYVRKVGWRAWTGLIWLRIGTGGGLL